MTKDNDNKGAIKEEHARNSDKKDLDLTMVTGGSYIWFEYNHWMLLITFWNRKDKEGKYIKQTIYSMTAGFASEEVRRGSRSVRACKGSADWSHDWGGNRWWWTVDGDELEDARRPRVTCSHNPTLPVSLMKLDSYSPYNSTLDANKLLL